MAVEKLESGVWNMVSGVDQKVLLSIETEDVSLFLKGVPYDLRYLSFKQYQNYLKFEQEWMKLDIDGIGIQTCMVFDASTNELRPYDQGPFPPIFFENGVYQLVILPKTDEPLDFYHEHPGLRNAVSAVGEKDRSLLMGQLDFKNEVGFSTFSIRKNGEEILSVTLEIFPSKLSYKKDYVQLLREVSDEVYNLAFHFIKKTYLTGNVESRNKPSATEFYRLLEHFFSEFLHAIQLIERQPHLQLKKEYEWVPAHRIRKADSRTRKFIAGRPHLFAEVEKGISINGKSFLPTKGWNVKKTITHDNWENRFVKYMMWRLVQKLDDLKRRLEGKNSRYDLEPDPETIQKIDEGKKLLTDRLQNSFWKQIGKLDRSVINQVVQMKAGYRDAFKIYLILMKGIILQGNLLRMSLKDVALLYEYWTYLKMGQILRTHFIIEKQDVVTYKYGSLFVKLEEGASAEQVFRHPQTNEKIILSYQKNIHSLPTVSQKPDIFLQIEKMGVDYTYNYVFDAKYRIDFGLDGNNPVGPGPMEDDINTMHRYRDALVVKCGGPYERHAFGAYVLFPWFDEENYENHPFYKSIDEVNIGGFPFLPNATKLVERFVERLVNSNPEELQEEGILPRGSIDYWESGLEEKVLVVSINKREPYLAAKQKKQVTIHAGTLRKGWERAKYVSLYVTQPVSKELSVENGIRFYGEIDRIDLQGDQGQMFVHFHVKAWQTLPHVIRPVGYGIQNHLLTSINLLRQAEELPELFMKSGEEMKLWRMLRRLTTKVRTTLDTTILDRAKKILAYQIGFYSVDLDTEKREIHVSYFGERQLTIPLSMLEKDPNRVFKILRDILFKD